MKSILLFFFLLGSIKSFSQNDCKNLFQIIDSLKYKRNLKEAIKVCSTIINSNCKDANTALNNRGSLYIDEKQYDSALIDLYKAKKIEPDNSQIIANIGVAFSYLEKYSQALSYLDTAINMEPNSSLYYQLRGDTKWNNGDDSGAIADYKKSILLDKHEVNAYEHLIKMYLGVEDWKNQEDMLDSAIANNPDHPKFIMQRGYFYFIIHNCEKAIQDYNTYLLIVPNDYQTWTRRGDCYDDIEEPEKAIEDYSKSISIKENYLAYYNRARIYKRELSNYKQAIEDNLKCIRLNPDYAVAYLNLGNCYFDTHEKGKAKEAYETALTKNPDPDTKDKIDYALSRF